MNHMLRGASIVIAVAVAAALGEGQDWPHWRGPAYTGSAEVTGLPTEFSKTEKVLWATTLPGPGEATPVVRQGRVFLASLDAETKELLALALDVRDGRVLWRKAVGKSRRVPQNQMVAPSPAADGERVVFLYGTGDVVAFDHGGRRLWARQLEKDFGPLSLKYGYSASPLLHAGKLYVAVVRRPETYRHNTRSAKGQESFLLALDPASGKDLWRQPRKTTARNESCDSYSSPIPFAAGGRSEIVLAGADCITAHDAASGKELWRWSYNPSRRDAQRLVPTPVAAGGLLFFVAPRGSAMVALRPGPAEALTGERVAWRLGGGPDVCSPLYYKGALYVLDGKRRKTLTCLDPASGKTRWRGRLGRSIFRASPTGADGKIYCINRAGEVYVVAADEFKVLARIALGEPKCDAGIVAAAGRLLVRTARKLYCIGNGPKAR